MARYRVEGLLVFLCSGYLMTSCSQRKISIASSDAGNPYTINNFCQDTSAISNTVVTILNGTHRLSTTCVIENANNVTLKAEQGTEAVITCEDCGFRFLNVSQLKISDIEFRRCGTAWSPSQELPIEGLPDVFHALVFANGSNIYLVNVSALYQGICIANVAGNTSVDFCKVSYTNISFYVAYDAAISMDANVQLTNSLITDNRNDHTTSTIILLQTSKANLLFENVTFSNNTNTDIAHATFIFTDLASVTISNTTFSDNNCAPLFFYIGNGDFHESKKKSALFPKLVSIFNSHFERNQAQGVYTVWSEKSQFVGNVLIDISNTRFSQNQGGAVLLQSESLATGDQLFMLNVTISNCTFSNHSGNGDLNGAITAYKVPYLVLDGITVEYNSHTGILAVLSTVVFSGSTKIAYNVAPIGGGLKLISTKMYLAPNADLLITNNSAQRTGGGIQLDKYHICTGLIDEECFYDHLNPNETDSNFTVANNHAVEGGDNIFGLSRGAFCDRSLHVTLNSKSANSSLSSKPSTIVWNRNICNMFNLCPFNLSYAYPGEKFTFEVLLLGNINSVVSGSVSATTTGVRIQDLEKIQKVSLSGSNVTYTLYSTKSSEAVIEVKPTDSECFLRPVVLTVHFLNCPLGFDLSEINDGKFACQCAPHLQVVSNCSIQTQTITKRKDSWLGKYDLNNHSYLATGDYCPYDYCKSAFQDIRSDNTTLYQDDQCQYNRTGILCGSCPEGWSLVLGSSECREECSNVWLLLILPFALAGLLLVTAVHFLNLTVTMGTLSGLIFYANIIQDYSVSVLSKYPIPGLTSILHIFLSWLNLDLGISTCFYHGMETFGKTMFLFVFPVYIWLISATIIALSNRYIFFTTIVGENAVKILSTLFLLSYSKILHATVDCLKLKSVDVYFNNFTSSETRWAVDGNISYFDPQRHLALFVIALFFIFLLLPFTMSLLCIRHVYSLSNCCRVFSCADKLKPFFDTYTGPFKDRARFWPGLLLFVRLVLILVHSMDYSDEVVPYYIIVAVCFILSTILIFHQGVYERQRLNILEYFFVLNLGAVFLINTYKEGPDSWKSIFTHLLVSLTLLAFLGIVAYHVYLKFSPFFKKRFQLRAQNADGDVDSLSFEGRRGYQPVQHDLDTFMQ